MNFLGRLKRGLFVWNIPPASESELAKAHAIVTQAASRLKNGQPGPGNEILAIVTEELWKAYELPVIAQEEVATALEKIGVFSEFVIGESPDGRSTLTWNTGEISDIQLEVCQSKGWKKVIVVAAPLHMGRTCWVYEKLGLEPLPAKMPAGMAQYFHPDYVHWANRGRVWRFYLREFCVRILFLLQGRI